MNSFVLLFIIILILASSSFTEAIKKRFIFRLDDVQDFYYSSAQQQILTWLMDNGYGVSAGIIGDYWNAQDAALFSVLQRCVSMSKDKCALFNHGSDAQYTFADASSVAEAQDQIKACDDKIKTYFPGYQVELFVPHQNSWGGFLLQALRNLGYSAVSASTLDYSNLPQSLTSNPIQLSQQTETGEYNSGGSWSAWPIDTAVADCEAAMARGDAVCVIMMHPFEFGDGVYTFAMLQQLINRLTALGYTSTNFHTIIQEVKGGVAPTGVSTPAPSFRPTAKPNAVTVAPTIATTRAPTIIQSSAPSYVPGSVSTAWGQCGGQTYTGPTNCPDGYTCTFGSIWYSQCKPCNGNCPQINSNTPTMATTPAPTVTTNAVVPTQTRVPTFKPTFSATTTLPKKRFIFRLDDVQDFSYSSAQQQILTWLMDRGYGVAAGIIGDLWNGADAALLSVLRRCVNLGKDKCALFNHGRNAEYIFATAPSVAEAQAQVQACDTKIKTVFPGYEIDLFVPHQNSWSNNLLQALRNMGYPAVSASTLDYSNLPQSLKTTPIQLSQQSETGRYNPDGSWSAWPVDNAVADCEAAMARGDAVCVIMMHPFEFGNGAYTFAMLQQLVDKLTALGYASTNFHTIIQEVKGGVQSTNAPTVLSTPAPSIRPTENPTRTAAPSALTTTSVSPTTRPTENPTRTAAPSALITARPSNSPNSVSTAWGQCGGATYAGPTNCPAGFTCVYGGFWYSQCNPCSGSCPTPSSSSTPAPTSPPGTVSAPWGQCAGIGYSGPSNCPNGFSCVYGSDWYSQCKPATTNSARASLDYQITVPVENVQGTGFSRASEAALMIAIRIIQEETGHHVDSLEVKANKVQANNPTNQLRFSSKVSDIQKEALVSTSFSLTLSMSIYMEDKDSAKTVYADSTTALTTAAKSGMLQTLFRNFAIQFNAVESSNAVITAVSSSKYSYDTPSSSSSSSNSSASSANIFMIVLPIGLCLLLFVSLSYFIIRYYRQQMEKDRLSKQSDALLITEKYVSADYTVASSERQSMDFVEDNFLHLHGIDCDVNAPKREEVPIEVAAFTETELPTAVEYANV